MRYSVGCHKCEPADLLPHVKCSEHAGSVWMDGVYHVEGLWDPLINKVS